MFYILIVDDTGRIVNEIEENDYESFIISCYNFYQDEGWENIYVSYVTDNDEVHQLPLAGIQKMIGHWLRRNGLSE
jgi:hypothetical protein